MRGHIGALLSALAAIAVSMLATLIPKYKAEPRVIKFSAHPWVKRGHSKTLAGGRGSSLAARIVYAVMCVARPIAMTAAVFAVLCLIHAGAPHNAAAQIAETAALTPKEVLDKLQTTFETFRNANDERLKQVEARGAADPLLSEKVEKANADITNLTAQLREVENLANRPRGGDSKEISEQAMLNARMFYAAATGKKLVEVRESDVDVKALREYRDGIEAYLRRDVVQNNISVGSSPEGGYWVSPDTTGRIVEFVYQTSPMRQYADVVQTTKDAKEGWTDLEEIGVPSKASEGSTTRNNINTSTPHIGKWRIPVHEMIAQPQLTQQMIDDEDRDMEGWLEGKTGRKFTRTENGWFVNGSGNGEAKGFVPYANASAPTASNWQRIQYVKSGANGAFLAAASFPADKIIDLMHSLKTEYRQGAIFSANNLTIAELRKLKTTTGEYLLQGDFTNGFSGRISGFGVVEFPDMADMATGSYSLAFANWKEGYTIVDRLGIRVVRDNLTTKGWVKFYTTKRVGGDVTNFEAIKLMQFSA